MSFFKQLLKNPIILALIAIIFAYPLNKGVINISIPSELASIAIIGLLYSVFTREIMSKKFKLLFASFFTLFFLIIYLSFSPPFMGLELFDLIVFIFITVIKSIASLIYACLSLLIINRIYLFAIIKSDKASNQSKITLKVFVIAVFIILLSVTIYEKMPVYNEFQRINDSNINLKNTSYLVLNDGRVIFSKNEIFDSNTEKFISTGEVSLWKDIRLIDRTCVSLGSKGIFKYNLQNSKFYFNYDFKKPRWGYKYIMLKNGKVLIVGGERANQYIKEAELCDQATKKCTLTGSLNIPRNIPGLILLDNGNVLVVGGDNSKEDTNQAELYNQDTGKFTLAGKFTNTYEVLKPVDPYKLFNGKYLILNEEKFITNTRALLYNPKTGEFEFTKKLDGTSRTDFSTAMLPNGKVLIIGGWIKYMGGFNLLKSTVIYNPVTNQFTPFKDLNNNNKTSTDFGKGQAITLNNGSILIVGEGTNGKKAEIFRYRK